MYYLVKYTGPFGFIKPWTAVRDSKTFSQQFLTPSIIEGLRQKLEVSSIVRYKLTYSSISVQQEQTQTRGWEKKTQMKMMVRNQSILERGVMIDPVLCLAFEKEEDAKKGAKQHICLCRNDYFKGYETTWRVSSYMENFCNRVNSSTPINDCFRLFPHNEYL